MKYEIYNGDHVGTAEWHGPGQVAVDMHDPRQQRWFQEFFSQQDSFLAPAGNHDGMICERRDESEAAFNRAAWRLAAYAYKLRRGDDRRARARARAEEVRS